LYSSLLIDIGSSNTKGGFRIKDQPNAACLSIPWGTATFSKKIANKDDKVAAALEFFSDSISYAITAAIQRDKELTNRPYVYFTGGIVWAMTNYLHPEDVKKEFTEFSKTDVDEFLRLAKEDYDSLINPDLSRITNPETLKEIRKQIGAKKIGSRDVFNKEDIIAGAMLLQGIMNQLDSTGPKKRYAFIRFGGVAWMQGYIVKKIDSDNSKLTEGK
jgi:hypothetical protein